MLIQCFNRFSIILISFLDWNIYKCLIEEHFPHFSLIFWRFLLHFNSSYVTLGNLMHCCAFMHFRHFIARRIIKFGLIGGSWCYFGHCLPFRPFVALKLKFVDVPVLLTGFCGKLGLRESGLRESGSRESGSRQSGSRQASRQSGSRWQLVAIEGAHGAWRRPSSFCLRRHALAAIDVMVRRSVATASHLLEVIAVCAMCLINNVNFDV